MINTSLSRIQQELTAGRLQMTDLVREYLLRVEESKSLNIYIEIFEEEALQKAEEIDAKLKAGEELGSLFGAVISIKDVICYKDHKVTAASKVLAGFTSLFTATALQRLLDEDAIVIGRTNCDEFAMGSTNENSFYGPTLNGIDPGRVAGGSSGAAAVSVERNTCLVALGSDTGGSVRQPAAFSGVYGFKPTYGRISRYGLIAYGSSFDQIGIIARNVHDISEVLSAMSGADPMDATSSDIKPPAVVISNSSHKYKIAYIPEVLEHKALNPEIKSDFLALLGKMKEQGHICEPIDFDLLPYMVPAYYVLTTAEASSNLSRYDGIRYGHRSDAKADIEELYTQSRSEGFGIEVKRRIMMGTFVLSIGYFDAYFTKAQQVRTLIIDRLENIFQEYDFIMVPTTTDVAWKRGELLDDPLAMYLSDIYTVMANLGGYPAISIPRQSTKLNLPFGIQFMAAKYQEEKLLSLCLSSM